MTRSTWLTTILACAAAVPGVAQTIELNGPFSSDGQVREFQVTPDGRRALYLADQEVSLANELYSVPTDGRSAPVKLNASLVPNARVSTPTLFPDGVRLAYRTYQTGDVYLSLYVGPLDGSAAAVKLSGAEGNVIDDLRITSDGAWIVYLATLDLNARALYSVRSDGSGSPMRLNIPGGGNHIMDFVLSPDGSRVVYRSDELVLRKFELFSVPTDGSSPRVRLHGQVNSNRDVSPGYLVDPTGARVVFNANHNSLGAIDLYSVPIDASAAPTRLNAPLAGSSTSGARISADGQRVVYTADQDTAGVYELFSVGIDGTSAPTKLSGPLAAGGHVGAFQLDPTGARVVYMAKQNDRVELYCVPADGSSPPVRLNDPLPPTFTSASLARITPDGGTVFFFEQSSNPTFETQLYAVPIDRSSSPRHLSRATIGRVGYFALDPSGRFVAFSTMQFDAPDSLYLVPLEGTRAPRLIETFPRIEGLSFTASALRVIHRTDLGVPYNSARLLATNLLKLVPH